MSEAVHAEPAAATARRGTFSDSLQAQAMDVKAIRHDPSVYAPPTHPSTQQTWQAPGTIAMLGVIGQAPGLTKELAKGGCFLWVITMP